jgi:hypothetical protein
MQEGRTRRKRRARESVIICPIALRSEESFCPQSRNWCAIPCPLCRCWHGETLHAVECGSHAPELRIDDVDDGDADFCERHMVVDDLDAVLEEVLRRAQLPGRLRDEVLQPSGRAALASHLQGLVAERRAGSTALMRTTRRQRIGGDLTSGLNIDVSLPHTRHKSLRSCRVRRVFIAKRLAHHLLLRMNAKRE